GKLWIIGVPIGDALRSGTGGGRAFRVACWANQSDCRPCNVTCPPRQDRADDVARALLKGLVRAFQERPIRPPRFWGENRGQSGKSLGVGCRKLLCSSVRTKVWTRPD